MRRKVSHQLATHSARARWLRKAALSLLVAAIAGCSAPTSPEIDPPRTIDYDPSWAPHGDTIAFSHIPQNASEMARGLDQVWLVDTRTLERRFLIEGTDPSWTADGDSIVFLRDEHVRIIGVNGGGDRVLTDLPGCVDVAAESHGSRVAIVTDAEDPHGSYAIWVLDRTVGQARDISVHGEGAWQDPAWTPSGRILHVRYVAVGGEVFAMDADGSNAVRLTADQEGDRDLACSADGASIAFSVASPPELQGLWLMAADGSRRARIRRAGLEPTFSPDCQRIAFIATGHRGWGTALWIMDRRWLAATELEGD